MRLELPDDWQFTHSIVVRVTDLNYGDHLANQHALTFAHEGRMAFYASKGFTEKDFGGVSLIQADAAVIYKAEAFYNDHLELKLTAIQSGNSSFDVFYQLTRRSDQQVIIEMRTAMVCFDYGTRKVVPIPAVVLESGLIIQPS